MRRTRTKANLEWPRWFYSPTGEGKIFLTPDEVPHGWTKTPDEIYEPPVCQTLDRESLISQLIEKGFQPHPMWSAAHMKELLD